MTDSIKVGLLILLTYISSLSNIEDFNKDEFVEKLNSKEIVEEKIETINIMAVGDIMMHGGQLRSGKIENGEYNFTPFFSHVKPIIEKGDITIANLETTLAGNKYKYAGYPQFNSPDSIIDALDYSGFNTLITTNNHSLDTGLYGLERTHKVIEEKGLDFIGTHDKENDTNYLIKEVKGIKIAIIAYTQHVNGLEQQYSSQTLNLIMNIIDKEKISSDIKKVKSHNPDLIIAYMHWGNEYKKTSNDFQKTYAKQLTKEGVDIIIGSHPHVIQESDFLEVDGNESYVFYSLGNFISNQRVETLGEKYRPTEDGAILDIRVEKNSKNNKTIIKKIDIIPTWVYRYPRENRPHYSFEIIPILEYNDHEKYFSKTIIDKIQNSSKETKDRIKLLNTLEKTKGE